MAGFIRPKSANYPNIYHEFEARDLHSNKFVKFRVQDFPRERYEEGVEYMVQNFFEHEVMGKSRRIKSDRVAVKEMSKIWRELLAKGLSLACFKENSDEIIAMNILDVTSSLDAEDKLKVNRSALFALDFSLNFLFKFQSQNLCDVFSAISYAQRQFDVCQHYNVSEYLMAYGLCVDTQYRARGIATEMLKARVPYLKALGLKVTTAVFTGIGSQIAAKKAGFEENFSIT